MVYYSDDSSESEKKLYVEADKVSPVNRRNSDEIPKTHGIVVINRSLSQKSPSKQKKKRNYSYRSRNKRIEYSSDDEQVGKLTTTNIEVEQFSSDNESEPTFQSPNTARARKHLFDDEEGKEIVSQDLDRSVSQYNANVAASDLSQNDHEKPINRRRILIKKEPISSEDEEPSGCKDPEKFSIKDDFSQPKKHPKPKNSEQGAGGNSSDGEIPPSQYWLHQYKEMEKHDDEEGAMKVIKKSSNMNSDSDDNVEIKRRTSLNPDSLNKKEFSPRKSPPRITKTEIISMKYERIDEHIEKNENKTCLEEDENDDIEETAGDSRRGLVGLRENGDYNQSDDQMSQGISERKLSPIKKRQSPKKTPASPKRKMGLEPKILNSISCVAAKSNIDKRNSRKRNLETKSSYTTLQPKLDICDNDTSSEEEKEHIKSEEESKKYVLALAMPKHSIQKTLNSNSKQIILVRKNYSHIAQDSESDFSDKCQSLQQRAPVPDHDDVSDESLSKGGPAGPSHMVEKKLSPKKERIGMNSSEEAEPFPRKPAAIQEQQTIKHPKPTGLRPVPSQKKFDLDDGSSNQETLEIERKVLLKKETHDIEHSNEVIPSVRGAATGQKQQTIEQREATESMPVSSKRRSNSNDKSSNKSTSVMKKKVSLKKKTQDIDSSNESRPSVRKALTSRKKQTIKQQEAIDSMSVPSKINSNSDDNSSDKEASPPPNISMRRKLSDTDCSEPRLKAPVHTMSDSDENDTLTRLNTTLNESMAFMENKSKTVKLNKSRKSVSINTKHNVPHVANDIGTRKSILKKPDQVAGNDSSESTNSSQEQDAQKNAEQNVQQNVQPINETPKIIERPINLRNFEYQESLVQDSTEASLMLGDISDDDEIYILEVPRTVNPKELKGRTIRLGGKNKLQIGDELYETCGKDPANISCIFRTDGKRSSYKTVNLRPAGCINVRQRLSKTMCVGLPSLEKRTVPFPENLKIRHPLFGAEYEDKIVITDKIVPTKIPRPLMKIEPQTKPNKGSSKVKQSFKKLENEEKRESKKVERSLKLIESESNSTRLNAEKNRQHDSTVSDNSDSESDASFFQTVKRKDIVDGEKRKKSKNSLSILYLGETSAARDLPVSSEETITAVERKELSASRNFGLSLISSVLKNNSFDANTDDSKLFSSTPIKVENDGKDYKGKISTHKVRKRKTHDDIMKGTTSPKKVKTN